MSWAVKTYKCQRCHLAIGDLHTWGTREYVLPNGVRLSMDWTLGWCPDCNGICAVELLDPAARQRDLDHATNDLKAYGPKPGQKADHQSVANWNYLAGLVEDAKDSLGIAFARFGHPRCLHCGGTNISPWQTIDG
jgi:hypothetical protein